MSIRTFNFYYDAGHGWLAVSRKLLEELGILDDISHYSYQKGGMVYLEEDDDASLFSNAMVAAGEKYRVNARHHGHDSWVRNCESFQK